MRMFASAALGLCMCLNMSAQSTDTTSTQMGGNTQMDKQKDMKHDNMKSGMHHGMTGKMDKDMAMKMMQAWPEASKMAAMDMMKKYGPPTEATMSMMMWKKNGPWLKTIVFDHEVKHDFPVAHTDVMEQWVAYKVPWDKYDEIAEYDGSVMPERTSGLISARCDKEGANFLALNLANDVATGKKNAKEARNYYANAIMMFMKESKMDPYMQKLNFQTMDMKQTADADKPAMMDDKMSMGGNMKDNK